jgi:hypothetical protein
VAVHDLIVDISAKTFVAMHNMHHSVSAARWEDVGMGAVPEATGIHYTLGPLATAFPLSVRAQQPHEARRIGLLNSLAETDSDAKPVVPSSADAR